MKAADVTDTLDLALDASGCNRAAVVQKPRLLNDNGSSYVAGDLANYLEGKGMDHVRGAPHHPRRGDPPPERDFCNNAEWDCEGSSPCRKVNAFCVREL